MMPTHWAIAAERPADAAADGVAALTAPAQASADLAAQRLAAIVESSSDAILAMTRDGIVTDWNRGAEQLYGYAAADIVGRPVTLLIPPERRHEEADILARLRRGERIDHYETVRRRKDGGDIQISLNVSPIKDAAGRIVGASKIARDITERKRAEERQQLLLREMNHRIKNLFALTGSLVSLSARAAKTPHDLAEAVTQRLAALARAHELTLPRLSGGETDAQPATTLHVLVRTILSPYETGADGERVAISGCDFPLSGSIVTSFALLLHEFATNAAKYGALAAPSGRVEIVCRADDSRLELLWCERGGPSADPGGEEGFGSLLSRATVKSQLGGELVREWTPCGLTIRLSAARDRLQA